MLVALPLSQVANVKIRREALTVKKEKSRRLDEAGHEALAAIALTFRADLAVWAQVELVPEYIEMAVAAMHAEDEATNPPNLKSALHKLNRSQLPKDWACPKIYL